MADSGPECPPGRAMCTVPCCMPIVHLLHKIQAPLGCDTGVFFHSVQPETLKNWKPYQ
jgi:hypothetical protein